MSQREFHCPHCNSANVAYQGEYSAPGYGQAWKCNDCENGFAVYAGRPEARPRIFEPEDVV